MNWRSFRLSKGISDFIFVLWSLFVATWPGILANWISDVSGRLLGIETSAGAWAVLAATIASILMYWIFRRRIDPKGPYNSPRQSDYNSKYYLMQGGMFTLGVTLNQVCQGLFSGPVSDAKILPIVMSLVPALEGVLGAQFIHVKNNQALYYVDAAIKNLVLHNARVSERMIVEHAGELAKRDNLDVFASLDATETNELVRSRMVHLAINHELDRFLDKNQRITLDSFHDPNQWRIEKKDIAPVKPIVTPAPEPIHADTGEQQKAKEIEETQMRAWQRLRSNFDDEDALYQLLRQAFHTTHGLVDSVRAKIATEMNRLLLSSQFPKHRELTSGEQDIIRKLGYILGYTQ